MLDDFLVRAALAGLGIAVIAGPMGCFVVWRRMAYFGDALAHTALLGVALGLLLSLDRRLGVLAICAAVAGLLVVFQRSGRHGTDTLLGILSHSALALGLVTLSFFETVRVDLMGYLFGDLLAVSRSDLGGIAIADVLILSALLVLWRPLLAATVDEDLARAEGVRVSAVSLAFTVLLAVVVAVAMQVVGVLLVTALLIIPAATARQLVRTPETMAFGAVAFGMLAVLLGLSASVRWDTPSGPSVVVAALSLFVLTEMFGVLRRRVRGGS